MESDYLKSLLQSSPDLGERYKMKLKLINNKDPFSLKSEELDYSMSICPPVTNMDIIAYLTLTHSYYTKEQMKAYKSLQAYKYFESGFVLKLGIQIINNYYVLLGKVKHSQKATTKPVDVFCIIAKDGSINTAHCTCMAGHSEVCSHVGAILFVVEYSYSQKEATSCTDVRATWPMPSMPRETLIVPVCRMNWGETSKPRLMENIPALSTNDINNVLEKISELGQTSVLTRIVEPFATKISKASEKSLPQLFDIFDSNNLEKNYSQLLLFADNIKLIIEKEQTRDIEECTRTQTNCDQWYSQRVGRITASLFKSACRTNINKPSLSLIKTICYRKKIPFCTKPMLWGITNEGNAVEEYRQHMEAEGHEDFIINLVGLLVNKTWPQFGASPDRLVFCECCLGRCLEVKCPYLLKINNIQDIEHYVSMKNTCLTKENNKVILKRNHAYYFQVQMQIYISNLLYCDFVVWSPNIFFKERILPDLEFWKKESAVALKFHRNCVMPELLGRYFTRHIGIHEDDWWCLCKGHDDGRPMIKCEALNCEIQWFHFECVALVKTPLDLWYCPQCKD